MTDIYLTISLSTHNWDDTPQNLVPTYVLQLNKKFSFKWT